MNKRRVRNYILVLSIGLLTVTTLFGCSKNSEEPTTSDKTRIISTEKGDVTVPGSPKRIVIQDYAGDLVALGIKPVAGNFPKEEYEDSYGEKDEYTQIASKLGVEEIMALDPDLIFITNEKEYDAVSKIAPTILIPSMKLATEERVEFIAKVVGKETESKNVLEEFNKRAEQNRKKLKDNGIENKTIIAIEGGVSELYLFGDKYGRGADVIYNYLWFKAPQKVEEKFKQGELFLHLSMEVLPEYSGDYILRSVYEGMEDVSSNNVWTSIPAVKNNRVIDINFDKFMTRDILTQNRQMDFITDEILKTLK